MIDETLRRCPFCGGRANVWQTYYHVYIYCENWENNYDRGHMIEVSAKTEKEARKLWEGNRAISD